MSVATNILLDCSLTIGFSLADLGGGETFGSPVTYKMDKATYKVGKHIADHNSGQDAVEFRRSSKKYWELTLEFKLYAGGTATTSLLYLAQTNELAVFTITSLTGISLGLSAAPGGIIESVEPEYAGPSTLKITIGSRGVMPSIS